MTAGVDAYLMGYSHGALAGHPFDPPCWMSKDDKDQYRKGFDDARIARGIR